MANITITRKHGAMIPTVPVGAPLAIVASLSALILAALLATLFNSWGIFLWAFCVAFIPLVGMFYPPILLVLFLCANLLVPKLPLIPVGDYMVPIRIEDVLLGCALLSLLVRFLILREKPAHNPVLVWMVAFSAITALSFLQGLFLLRSVPGAQIGFLYWLRAPEYFAASYLCLLGVKSWKQYRQMLIALGVCVVLIGAYGMLQEFSLVPVFDSSHETGEIVYLRFFPGFGQDRLYSTFGNPLDLPATFLIIIPCVMALFVTAVSLGTRLLLGGVLAVSFLCFYLTYARAPLIALVLGLGVSLWLLNKRRLGIALAAISALPAFLLTGYVSRIQTAVDDPLSYAALGGRIGGSFADAISAVARSPLLGTGPASLPLGLGADGLYFMLMGIWGIGGLACFLVLIYKVIYWQREYIHTSRNRMQRAMSIGLFAGALGLLLIGVTMDSFYSSKVAFTFWFLTGLLFAGSALERQNDDDRGATHVLPMGHLGTS